MYYFWCNKGLQVPANAGENLCHQIQHNDLLIMPFHLFSIFYCNQMNGNKKRDTDQQTYRSAGYSTMRFHKMYWNIFIIYVQKVASMLSIIYLKFVRQVENHLSDLIRNSSSWANLHRPKFFYVTSLDIDINSHFM